MCLIAVLFIITLNSGCSEPLVPDTPWEKVANIEDDAVVSIPAPTQYETSTEEGVTMRLDAVTPRGATVSYVLTTIEEGTEVTTGTWYGLEKEGEEGWEPLDYVFTDTEVGWNSIAYSIAPEGVTTFEIDWEWLYGELAPVNYRLLKEIYEE